MELVLLGNSNVGKTTFFNCLTQSDEHTGNWAGVTVKALERRSVGLERNVLVTDLPGIYSLHCYSMEEETAYRYLLESREKKILNLTEANSLNRNLYLTLQVLEMGLSVSVGINMEEELRRNGGRIDCTKLSRELGVPVFTVDARKRTEVLRAAEKCLCAGKSNFKAPYLNDYPFTEIKTICKEELKNIPNPQWAIVRLFLGEFSEFPNLSETQRNRLDEIRNQFTSPEMYLAQLRYRYLDRILEGIYFPAQKRQKFSDLLFTNRFFCGFFYLSVLLVIFYTVFGRFGVGGLCAAGLQEVFGRIESLLRNFCRENTLEPWVSAFLTEGVWKGLTGVVGFLPQIVLLFVFLAILEDSGLLARMTFFADGFLSKIGMSGKSVFTLMMGFGCNSTAILTSENLENKRLQKRTVLMVPFVSCSAKIPVFLAILSMSGNTFPDFLILAGLYIFGIFMGIVVSRLLYGWESRRTETEYVFEIPLLRKPQAKRIRKVVAENAKSFLKRVGTVLFAVIVVGWFLQNFDFALHYVGENTETSVLGEIGKILSPLFAPLGWKDWRICVALILGFVAKEAVAGSLLILFPNGFSWISQGAVIALLIYILLYVPCVATVGMIAKTCGKKTAAFSVVLNLSVAYACGILTNLLFGVLPKLDVSLVATGISLVLLALSVVFVVKYFRKNKCARCPNAKICDRKEYGTYGVFKRKGVRSVSDTKNIEK